MKWRLINIISRSATDFTDFTSSRSSQKISATENEQ
jgi:hypothetical protein